MIVSLNIDFDGHDDIARKLTDDHTVYIVLSILVEY